MKGGSSAKENRSFQIWFLGKHNVLDWIIPCLYLSEKNMRYFEVWTQTIICGYCVLSEKCPVNASPFLNQFLWFWFSIILVNLLWPYLFAKNKDHIVILQCFLPRPRFNVFFFAVILINKRLHAAVKKWIEQKISRIQDIRISSQNFGSKKQSFSDAVYWPVLISTYVRYTRF